MSRTTSRSLHSFAALLLRIVICLAACDPLTASAQSADETALRLLADRFFNAYQKRDLNAILPLWSEKSPNLSAAKQTFERTFAANKLELKSLTFRKITVEGGKGSMRVVVEISAVDSKTGSAASGFGKLNRTLDCVKESEGWKVWRYVPAEEDLAVALATAQTDEERKALLAAEKEMQTSDLVQAMLVQVRRLYNQSSYSRALEVIELTSEIAVRLGDRRQTAVALRVTGAIYYAKGNNTAALDYYEKSLSLAEELSDKSQIAFGLNNIGLVYGLQGNTTRALEYFQRAVKIREEIGDLGGLAESLNNAGLVHKSQGNYPQSLDFFQTSLELKESIGDRSGAAGTLNNIGLVHVMQGRYRQALECYQKSLRIKEEVGDKPAMANALTNIGNVHIRQSNYKQALEYYEKSLKLYEEIGNQAGIAATLLNMGLVCHSQGNYTEALNYLQRSLKINQEVGDKARLALIFNNIGAAYYSLGDDVRALESYQKSLKIREEIGDKAGIARTLTHIAESYLKRSNYAEAVELANRAAAIAKQIGSPDHLLTSLTRAGEGYRRLGQLEQARHAFSEAILATEDLHAQVAGDEQQQQQSFEDKLSPYYQIVDLLIEQKNFVEALAYVERIKGRTLLDVLQNGRAGITRAMTSAEQEEELKLKSEVVSLNIQIKHERQQERPSPSEFADLDARLQKARLHYESFQFSLYAAHPELKVHRGQSPPLSLDQAATLIPDPATALLEFVVAQDRVHLMVITREQCSNGKDVSSTAATLRVYVLNVKPHDLADRVERFRRRLASLDFKVQEPARELYDLLLGPARAELQNKTNLVIVPDGILWELPFQTLQPKPGRYLIENAAISYAPSLTVLLEMTRPGAKTATNSSTLLAFGNPVIGKQTTEKVHSVLLDERLDPLPETERQVKMLAKLYGPGRSKVYIGRDAQEARLKAEASGYRILHVAAHGILNDKNPMYSQLVLSQPEGDINEDGMLEAWEIMNLDLRADLVVLSACQTARGKVGNGEGMIGLAWAFFVAGVPTTVASQWSVEDASTAELMIEFHRNLERHIGKAESLRQAMLKLLRTERYKRPFYWAGFVVVGNGR